MAVTSKHIPQAYTRETLVKAIEWLNAQPTNVRERAQSADLIVSHYLQARRQAALHVEAPVSQETFKSDLRHLAQDLRQFEEPQPPHTTRSPSYVMPTEEQVEPIFKPEPRQESLFRQPMATSHPPVAAETSSSPPQTRQTETSLKGLSWNVDSRSLALARELRERLNLSSEAEALRMLVTLGAERVRGL